MSASQNSIFLAARILLGLIFVMAGFGKTADVAGFAAFVASGGLPAALAWPVIAFEILGGLALILGVQTRIAALALGLFSLAAALLYHAPTDPAQITNFLKNLAMAGGYLLLAFTGPGAWSVDAWLGRSRTGTAAA